MRSGVPKHPEDTVLMHLTDLVRKSGVLDPETDLLTAEPSGGGRNVDIGTGSNGQNYGLFADAGSYSANDPNRSTGRNTAYTTPTNQDAGGDAAHNNLQPYMALKYVISY